MALTQTEIEIDEMGAGQVKNTHTKVGFLTHCTTYSKGSETGDIHV